MSQARSSDFCLDPVLIGYRKLAHGVMAIGTVNPVHGGTIARVMIASKKRGFSVIFPVGLEKLVPIPIKEVAKEAKKKSYEYAMGMPCGLFPCQGTTITELKAIEILSGATAVPIAAGGLGGAEGATTLVIKGDREKVEAAIRYVEESKGAKLPQVRTASNKYTYIAFPI